MPSSFVFPVLVLPGLNVAFVLSFLTQDSKLLSVVERSNSVPGSSHVPTRGPDAVAHYSIDSTSNVKRSKDHIGLGNDRDRLITRESRQYEVTVYTVSTAEEKSSILEPQPT